jgi:hypothetical protein
MGVKNLSSEAAGFLYTIFHEAAKSLQHPATPLDAQEKKTAFDLSFEFERAKGAARFNKAAELETAIPKLVDAVNNFTTPGLKDIAEELRLKQQLMYRHASPQLKDDLGAYGKGIF